jgi:hypothetical protein
VIIPDYYKDRFEELDEQRRRINDEFNNLVQSIRDGSIRDSDRARNQAQFLNVRHDGLIREMIDMLVYT